MRRKSLKQVKRAIIDVYLKWIPKEFQANSNEED